MRLLLTVFAIGILPLVSWAQSQSVEEEVLFYPTSNQEFIPAFDNFDLIEDKMQCIDSEMPLNYNERVHAFVNYFAVKDRVYTKRMIERSAYYFPIFEKYLKKYDLPEELKYLSLIESGLNPKAKSRAKAVGLWQFMYATGKYYGLHIDNFIDERMDPEESTDAACRYLKSLYGMFGDWELALAAYNSGPGAVRKAIRKSGYKKSFWEIYPNLYRETRGYVPQFVAIYYVMHYADDHNFMDVELQHPVKKDTIMLKEHVDFATLANQLNICAEELHQLNPGIRYTAKPKTAKHFAIHIPADKAEVFRANKAAIVDTVSKVGKKELLAKAKNDMGSTYGKNKIVYRVKSGDVLGKIAMRYNVRVSSIKRWNNLHSDMIRSGQKLNIYLNGKAPKQSQSTTQKQVASSKVQKTPQKIDGKIIYYVQPGDTLWDISLKYKGLSIEKIKELNGLTSDKLKPGQKLILG